MLGVVRPALRVEAIGSEEGLVGVEVLDHVERPGAFDGVELPPVETAQEDELEAQTPGLGGGREVVRDDPRLEVGVDVAQDVHDRRARAEEHGVARFDHGGGGPGDALLLGRVGDDVLLVGRFVGEVPAAHGATVRAGQDAFLLEEPQVAADGDLGDAEVFAEGGDAHGPVSSEPGDDPRAPFGGEHLAHVGSGQSAPSPRASSIMTGHLRSEMIGF